MKPAARGTVIALVAALAFGVTMPLLQRFARGAGPFAVAALLYMGAGLVGAATGSSREARIERKHFGRIALVATFGAGLAPAMLAWGLGHASGIAASLMLSSEAVFTIGLARVFHHEHVGGRVAAAAALLLLGGALLVVDRHGGESGASELVGLSAVMGASLAWALDNTMSKPLALLDPSNVVAAKSAIGATLSVAAALVLGDRWPALPAAITIALLGAVGYGLSLRLYLRAQRELGAGRTASVFASAPFCGALVASFLGEPAGWIAGGGALFMAAGVFLHVTEEHAHAHRHDAVEHAHAHRHDDGHHEHVHDPMPEGEHTHVHRHGVVEHAHAHVPDVHHEHTHAADGEDG